MEQMKEKDFREIFSGEVLPQHTRSKEDGMKAAKE